MTTPNHTPDLSPANLARVLREAEYAVLAIYNAEPLHLELGRTMNKLRALADALEGQGMTWETRLACAAVAMRYATGWTEKERAAKVLFAAFPEFAPEAD